MHFLTLYIPFTNNILDVCLSQRWDRFWPKVHEADEECAECSVRGRQYNNSRSSALCPWFGTECLLKLDKQVGWSATREWLSPLAIVFQACRILMCVHVVVLALLQAQCYLFISCPNIAKLVIFLFTSLRSWLSTTYRMTWITSTETSIFYVDFGDTCTYICIYIYNIAFKTKQTSSYFCELPIFTHIFFELYLFMCSYLALAMSGLWIF